MIEQSLWTTKRQELRSPVEYLKQLTDNIRLIDPFTPVDSPQTAVKVTIGAEAKGKN
jgi:hypothetical protein